MKKILLTIGLAALVSSSQAQGLLNFVNSAATVINLRSNGVSLGTTPTTLGGFRYELFRAPAGTAVDNGFVASGLIATNTAVAGRFIAGNGLALPGTSLGGTAAILIRGWSANLGLNWAEAFSKYGIVDGYFGQSAIASNFLLGGDGGAGNIPTSPVFGGTSGIVAAGANNGFTLDFVGVIPEPSSMVLAGLGAASLLMFRRKK